MKRITAITLAALTLLSVPALGLASNWNIDPAHSEVGFKVRHMMISNVRGAFADVKGTIKFDETDIAKSKIDVTIQAASINTGVDKRDEHLRSADFFDVEKFPTLSFRSTKVKQANAGKLEVLGDLTLHGVTREVVLDVEGPTREMKDPWGNVKVGVFATTKINRKDFGLTWNTALEAGGVLVGEEVSINLDLQLVKQADKTAQQ